MTVADLIARLKDLPQDLPVTYACDRYEEDHVTEVRVSSLPYYLSPTRKDVTEGAVYLC